MDDEIFIGVNLEYYYNLIKNWSVNRGGRKPDWVAFCKNWIMQDVANKKAIMQSSFISNTQYIKGYE
jgi:hypothetical protein